MFNKKSFLSLICIFIIVSQVHANNLKTSVIIPCFYKHAQHLVSLLHAYEEQTVLPDEVVVSLSEVHKVEKSILEELNNTHWKFPVKIYTTQEVKYAGQNRNIACKNALGDIFICQDADDVPHPQRVEIVKYLFENHKVDHLMHGHFEVNGTMEMPAFPTLKSLESIDLYWDQDLSTIREKLHCHRGNVIISKELFGRVQWTAKPRSQDTEFNKKVYAQKNNKCLCIKVPLLGYRYYLSSMPHLNKRIKRDLALNQKK